jgi:MFS family permease
LFLASFITLIAAGVGFSIRSGILDDWGRQFGFTQPELGAITGSGLWGFGLAIVFFSLLADRVGYGRLMAVAFVLHVLSAVLTLAASFVFQHHGKEATYWLLYAGMSLFALANGTCEAVINPLTATLYPKRRRIT